MQKPTRFDIGFEGKGLLGCESFSSTTHFSHAEYMADPLWTTRRWYQVLLVDMSFPGTSWIVAGLNDEINEFLVKAGAGDYSLRLGDTSQFQRPYLEIYDTAIATLFRLTYDFPVCDDFPERTS